MNCKNCKRKVPERALHFSNQVAIKEGYCWIGCMMADLGKEKALKGLQKYKNIIE